MQYHKASVGAPKGRKVYNFYLTYKCSYKLRGEYVVVCARNGHHYYLKSVKGSSHNRIIIIYRIKSGTYILTFYDVDSRSCYQFKFSREQSIVFWLERLKDGDIKL
jgi:hypothetical protein